MKFRDLFLFASSVAAASQVCALSLGGSQGNVQLGHPIDLVFAVQPDAGQLLPNSCLRADIWMGDAALASSQVQVTALEQTVRVRSTTPVYEPLVTLKLSAGCADTTSRSYTFFADPPSTLAASVAPIDLSKIQVAPLPVVPRTAAPRPVPAVAPEKKARTAKRLINASAAQHSAQAIAPAPSEAATDAPAAALPTSAAVSTAASAPAAPREQPRLRIEPLEGLVDTSLAPAAEEPALAPPASSMEPPAAPLVDANTARLEALEQQLQTLQQQLSSNRSEIVGLQSQLVQAQNAGLPVWVHLVLGLLALALAAIAWLLQRLKQERSNARHAWAHTVLAAEDVPAAAKAPLHVEPFAAPANTASPAAPQTAAPQTNSTPARPGSAAPAAPTQRPAPLATPAPLQDKALTPPSTLRAAAPSSGAPLIAQVLTAQALFDVQEQAEFYASIGENDHAIEILQTHIAAHENSSPLAYIELLQLLYRLGRTDMFEQVREKFQTYFNVNVPEFLEFAHQGQDLHSGYPQVLAHIEAQWASDDVQALLRSLMVHPSPQTAPGDAQRFDLCAFNDLLRLYNVAQTTPAAKRGPLSGRLHTAPAHADASPAATAPPMADAYLDLLHSAPAALAPAADHSDAPLPAPPESTPNDALLDSLSLEWEEPTPAQAAPSPAPMLDIDEALKSIQLEDQPPRTPKGPPSAH